MGIQGLRQLLRQIEFADHVSCYSTIGIDGRYLLQSGADRVKHTINKIRDAGVTPFIIFDGKCPVQSSVPRPVINPTVIEKVRNDTGCVVLVADQDAGAQLSYMYGTGIIEVVLTDDTNLFLHGCARIMLDFADDGTGLTIDINNLNSVSSPLDLSTWTPLKFWEWCVMGGVSDHWAMPYGLMFRHSGEMGLVESFKYIHRFGNIECCLQDMRNNPLVVISDSYEEDVKKCWSHLIHQPITFIHNKLGELIFFLA